MATTGLNLVETQTTSFVYGRTGKRLSTASNSTQNNLHVLCALVDALRPTRTLEVGLALGHSAIAIADKHRAGNAPPSGQHIAIDPFQESVWDDYGMLALEAAGLSPYCSVIRDYSWRALPRLSETNVDFGLLYIDGSHLFEDVFIDLFYCARLVSPGGVVLFDDASDPHVAKVIRFVRRNMRHAFREMALDKYRSVTTVADRLKYLAASALGRLQLVAFERIGDPVRGWNSPLTEF